ncbi:MAG TPA: hypothetical protein VFE62_13570 [Gemmataceae bacterium]|nr:hypothetical protein [Gemmataceae bacterium]
MATHVRINVGEKIYALEADLIPPVGTKLPAHKHLSAGGTAQLLEVIAHEWRLEEGSGENENPELWLMVKTRIVEKR